MTRALALAAAALAASGCMTYDFEPVAPFALAQTTDAQARAARQKFNLMMVVDKSGSMNQTIPVGCTGSACATRMTELKSAMSAFLTYHADKARIGLTTFPNVDVGCGTGGRRLLDLPAPPTALDAEIQKLVAGGGTPSAATLRELLGYAPLLEKDRRNVVLLLTDGLPNCNAQSPANPATCACTAAACGSTGNCPSRDFCLDDAGAVAAIKALRASGIDTVVVGFGADLACGQAPAVLDAMADAGGLARTCAGCSRFYPASNGAELGTALDGIIKRLYEKPCEFTLSARPTREDAQLVSVHVDGAYVAPGPETWSYADGKVTFAGEICKRLEASTEETPVPVEIRIVEAL